MKDIKDIRDIQNKIVPLIRRFNLVIFIVIVVLVLSVNVVMLYGVVEKASGTDLDDTAGGGAQFDQETINRLEKLKTSDQPSTPLDLSKGRINPFSE